MVIENCQQVCTQERFQNILFFVARSASSLAPRALHKLLHRRLAREANAGFLIENVMSRHQPDDLRRWVQALAAEHIQIQLWCAGVRGAGL